MCLRLHVLARVQYFVSYAKRSLITELFVSHSSTTPTVITKLELLHKMVAILTNVICIYVDVHG